MNTPPVVAKNPNAFVSLLTGVAGGQIIVNIADHVFGWSISTGWGMGIASGISGAVLFFWDKGLRGAWNRILDGKAV